MKIHVMICLISLMCISTFALAQGTGAYQAEIDAWHRERIDKLKQPDSWLSLMGLYWLEPGVYRFGSAPENDLVFPDKAAPFMGTISVNDSMVVAKINRDVSVTSDQKRVDMLILMTDKMEVAPVMEYETLRWFVIVRDGHFAIRLRDLEADLLTAFDGIDRFPVDSTWRVPAQLEPYDPPRVMSVPTVYGAVLEQETPGALVFEIDGAAYRLDPSQAGEGYFVVFGDETNGEQTYGGGRFLYVEPNENGEIWIDFNKAYNPPCVFSDFATCPLPPQQNKLAVAITAGEKMWGEPH